MDKNEFRNPTFQRVYQYLIRHTGNKNLDRFKYQGNVEGSTADCLKLFLEYINLLISMHAPYVVITTLGVVECRIHLGLKSTILLSF